MLYILFMSVLVTTTIAVVCGMLYMAAIRTSPVLAAGPFAPGGVDPSADTMGGQAQTNTVFIDTGWHTTTLTRLCDVEDFLDQLEAHRITEREVVTLGNASFAVRWK
jgi:hypothetical protein